MKKKTFSGANAEKKNRFHVNPADNVYVNVNEVKHK